MTPGDGKATGSGGALFNPEQCLAYGRLGQAQGKPNQDIFIPIQYAQGIHRWGWWVWSGQMVRNSPFGYWNKSCNFAHFIYTWNTDSSSRECSRLLASMWTGIETDCMGLPGVTLSTPYLRCKGRQSLRRVTSTWGTLSQAKVTIPNPRIPASFTTLSLLEQPTWANSALLTDGVSIGRSPKWNTNTVLWPSALFQHWPLPVLQSFEMKCRIFWNTNIFTVATVVIVSIWLSCGRNRMSCTMFAGINSEMNISMRSDAVDFFVMES